MSLSARTRGPEDCVIRQPSAGSTPRSPARSADGRRRGAAGRRAGWPAARSCSAARRAGSAARRSSRPAPGRVPAPCREWRRGGGAGRSRSAARPAGPACRDARGALNRSWPRPSSTMRPAYMTATRSTFSATTPRSWLISTSAMPVSRRMPASRARICAWMVASSAVVGSSATSRSGCPASAMAIMTRWFMPARKLVRIVAQPPLGIGDADLVEQTQRLGLGRRAAEAAMQLQRLAELAADAMHRVEAARRVLEDHGDALAAHALEQRAPARRPAAGPPGAPSRRHGRAPAAGRAPPARSRSCPSPIRPRCPAPRPARSTDRRRRRRANDPSFREIDGEPARSRPGERSSPPQLVAKLTVRNSIAKDGEAFQRMSLRLAVKVAFWCSTV